MCVRGCARARWREGGGGGGGGGANQPEREVLIAPCSRSLSQSELVPVYRFVWLWWKSAHRSSPCVPGLLSEPEPGQRVPDGLCGRRSGQTEAERPDRGQTPVQEVKVDPFDPEPEQQGLVLVPGPILMFLTQQVSSVTQVCDQSKCRRHRRRSLTETLVTWSRHRLKPLSLNSLALNRHRALWPGHKQVWACFSRLRGDCFRNPIISES